MDQKAESERIPTGFSSFYKTRKRIYGALLLFVLVVGLPVGIVPKLRNRLIARAQDLSDAIRGKHAPLMVQVGANNEPLPPEFARPAPPVPQILQLPPSASIHSTTRGVYVPRRGEAPPSSKAGNIETSSSSSAQGEAVPEQTETGQAAESNEPKYQKGNAEQDAYDLLIKSNSSVAEIVKGNNPSYKFKSWDAANRGADTYWVRLTLQTKENPEAEFIWQVNLQSKQVSPLNYNARSIS